MVKKQTGKEDITQIRKDSELLVVVLTARARKQSGKIKTELKKQQTSSFIGHSRCHTETDGCPVTHLKQL